MNRMSKEVIATRNSQRQHFLSLEPRNTNIYIQCKEVNTGTYYKCQLVRVRKLGRGISIILFRFSDSCHWRVRFGSIDNILFITRNEACQKPFSWTPSAEPDFSERHSSSFQSPSMMSPPMTNIPSPVKSASMMSPPMTNTSPITPLTQMINRGTLEEIANMPLPSTRSIEAIHKSFRSHEPSTVPRMNMVCIHGLLDNCSHCASQTSQDDIDELLSMLE